MMSSFFGETTYNITRRNLRDIYRENGEVINATAMAVVMPATAWFFLSPWAAAPITLAGCVGGLGCAVIAPHHGSLRARTLAAGLFGSLIFLATGAMSSVEHDAKEPSTVPSVIAATMNEVCWSPNQKFLMRIPVPKTQNQELAAAGLSIEKGPSYARHPDPDASTQWYEPYVPNTKARNPFYTAEVTINPQAIPATSNGLKSYLVTIDNISAKSDGKKIATYDVAYSYHGWWQGNLIHRDVKFTTAARPEECPASARAKATATP